MSNSNKTFRRIDAFLKEVEVIVEVLFPFSIPASGREPRSTWITPSPTERSRESESG